MQDKESEGLTYRSHTKVRWRLDVQGEGGEKVLKAIPQSVKISHHKSCVAAFID